MKQSETVRLAVERFNRVAKLEQPITAKQQEQMIYDIFEMLAPRMLDGFVMKLPYDLGSICLSVQYNYKYAPNNENKKKVDWKATMEDPNHRRHYYSRQKQLHFLSWTPGDKNYLLMYHFSQCDEMKRRLDEVLSSGKKVFAYEKRYKGNLDL